MTEGSFVQEYIDKPFLIYIHIKGITQLDLATEGSFVQEYIDKPFLIYIHIKGITQLDLTTEGSFVQEYIDKQFLIDGHKFDIGIYTTLTSVDPLRLDNIYYL